MKKALLTICLLVMVSGCSITKYNPSTGEIERSRFMTDSDIQGFLAELPDGSHVEWESATSDVSDSVKAMIEIYIAGLKAGAAGVTP